MNCDLCSAQSEQFRLIAESIHSFVVVCKSPLKEGHVMVLPKRHVETYTELTPDELCDLHAEAEKVRISLAQAFEEPPILLRNFGRHSTQPHLHIHILPSKGALRDLISTYERVPHRFDPPQEVTLAMRDKVKSALASMKQHQSRIDEHQAEPDTTSRQA